MATEALTLSADAFARLVTEHKLQVEGPFLGYIYTGKQGRNGWEMFKTYASKKWIYQARRVAQQTNVAGGAIKIDISVATGQIAKLVHIAAANSGTNEVNIFVRNEDAAQTADLCRVGSAGSTIGSAPRVNTSMTTTGYHINSTGLILAPGESLAPEQGVAGAQNDTFTVAVVLEIYNVPTLPTWSVARSTNAADVTLAASTISEANTLQEVLC